MPFKRLGLRAWTTAAVVMAAYVGLGFPEAHNGTAEEWMVRIGTLAGSVIPLIFIVIYTWFGLQGEGKWWRYRLGTAVVFAAFGLFLVCWPLAWTFWVDAGIETPSWLAWAQVASFPVAALAWGWLCILWIRVHIFGQSGGV